MNRHPHRARLRRTCHRHLESLWPLTKKERRTSTHKTVLCLSHNQPPQFAQTMSQQTQQSDFNHALDSTTNKTTESYTKYGSDRIRFNSILFYHSYHVEITDGFQLFSRTAFLGTTATPSRIVNCASSGSSVSPCSLTIFT